MLPHRDPHLPPSNPGGPAADPCPSYVEANGVLCRLAVWGPGRWEATPEALRPTAAEFVEGLGWLVAIPEPTLNN